MAMLGDRQSVVIFVVEFSLLITFYLIYFSVQSIYLDKTKKSWALMHAGGHCKAQVCFLMLRPHLQ